MIGQQCYLCVHVLTSERPVFYVCRDEGDWILAAAVTMIPCCA